MTTSLLTADSCCGQRSELSNDC